MAIPHRHHHKAHRSKRTHHRAQYYIHTPLSLSLSTSTTTTAFSAAAHVSPPPPPLIVGAWGTTPNKAWRSSRATTVTTVAKATTNIQMGQQQEGGEAEEKVFSPSSFIKAVDDSTSDTFDESSCRALLERCGGGDGKWASFDERWAAAVAASSASSDSATAVVSKQQVLQSICAYPPEVFDDDDTSGTTRRAEARAVNDEAEAAAAGTPHFYELEPEEARVNRRKLYVHSKKRRDVSFETEEEGAQAGGASKKKMMKKVINFATWTPSHAGSFTGVILVAFARLLRRKAVELAYTHTHTHTHTHVLLYGYTAKTIGGGDGPNRRERSQNRHEL